jgi:hypothetical protein
MDDRELIPVVMAPVMMVMTAMPVVHAFEVFTVATFGTFSTTCSPFTAFRALTSTLHDLVSLGENRRRTLLAQIGWPGFSPLRMHST